LDFGFWIRGARGDSGVDRSIGWVEPRHHFGFWILDFGLGEPEGTGEWIDL
jgi:hypothetical protein